MKIEIEREQNNVTDKMRNKKEQQCSNTERMVNGKGHLEMERTERQR